MDWGQIRCHCSIYQKIQDHLDRESQYCFPAQKVSTSVQTEGVQTDASSQTDAMVETDILQENMKYESDVESNVESDVESDLESDMASEGLVEPVPVVPVVPEMADNPSTLSMQFPTVEIKMSVGRGGKCTACRRSRIRTLRN